jgi:hypothetical protein
MPVYKVTIGFVRNVFGASETYYTAEGTTDSAIGPTVETLLNYRAKMLPVGVEFVGVRIGLAPVANLQTPAPRRSNFYPPDVYNLNEDGIALTVPATGKLPATVDDENAFLNGKQECDQAKASLMCRIRFDSDRRANRYLCFPPDNVLFSEPDSYHPDGYPGWNTLMLGFLPLLKSGGWQIRARSRDPGYTETPIVSWYQAAAAPSIMGVVLPSQPATTIVPGDWVAIKGVRRKGTDKTSYNGKYRVSSINPTFASGQIVIYLEGSEAGQASTVKIPGSIQKVAYKYYPFDFFSGYKATTHKRGRPFSAPLGRRKKQTSLNG